MLASMGVVGGADFRGQPATALGFQWQRPRLGRTFQRPAVSSGLLRGLA